MTFSQVSLRLRAIKYEIRDIKLAPVVDVKEKIHNLKRINALLKEQNILLCVRQDHLNAICSNCSQLPSHKEFLHDNNNEDMT